MITPIQAGKDKSKRNKHTVARPKSPAKKSHTYRKPNKGQGFLSRRQGSKSKSIPLPLMMAKVINLNLDHLTGLIEEGERVSGFAVRRGCFCREYRCSGSGLEVEADKGRRVFYIYILCIL